MPMLIRQRLLRFRHKCLCLRDFSVLGSSLYSSRGPRRSASSSYSSFSSSSSSPPHVLEELRRLFKLVHPDLFHRYPQQQEINERSFQLLQEYLSVAKGSYRNLSIGEYRFEFYVQQEQQDLKKVELSLPAPQTGLQGAEMPASTKVALGRLLSAFGLSAEFTGSLTGDEAPTDKIRLSELFQQASELQRQNETTLLGIEQRMIVIRNALRIGRGVTASFRIKSMTLSSQLQVLETLARVLDTVPNVELRGSAIMIGDSCGVDGMGNLWLNHEDAASFWSTFFRQLDVNTLNMKKIAHRERRLKEFKAARYMEVEMIFTDDAVALKSEYTTFLEKLAEDAEAMGAVGEGKFHDLPIRIVEEGELSVDERMGYINVPLTESFSNIYRYIEEHGSYAVDVRMDFKAEEQKMVHLNDHVRKKLRLRHLAFDDKLDEDQIKAACMKLLTNASKLRILTEGLSMCISDEYRLPIEGTRSLMHLKWNFSMADF